MARFCFLASACLVVVGCELETVDDETLMQEEAASSTIHSQHAQRVCVCVAVVIVAAAA